MTPYSIGVVGDLGLWGVPESIRTPIGRVPVAGLANTGPGAPNSSSTQVTSMPGVPVAYTPQHTTFDSINDYAQSGGIDFIMHIGDIAYAYVYM